MWVLKLGGSLAGSAGLADWAHGLARAGAGRCVVVTGGGQFADQVRRAQRRWGCDDRTAHRMALRAMDQSGLLFAALAPGLVPAPDAEAIARVLAGGETPVWLPAGHAGTDPSLPQSWDTTSDSLAAWLASELGASALVLVKSVRLLDPEVAVDALAARRIVDAGLPARLRAFSGSTHLADAGAAAAVCRALESADPTALVRVRP